MTSRQRAGLLGLAAAVLTAAAVLAATRGGGSQPAVIDTRTQTAATSAPSRAVTSAPAARRPARPDTAIVVRDGEPVGGPRRLRYRKGSRIVFTVRSDAAAEVHLHGYDVSREVPAGGAARFSVAATLEGRFEVELEQTQTEIARVEVVP